MVRHPGVLFFSLVCFSVVTLSWGGRSYAQEIDYKLVTNLEETKDYGLAPDFTLPLLRSEGGQDDGSLTGRLLSWVRNILGENQTTTNTPEESISLKDFRGRLVLLNFWASWCEPCREEMPAMERLYREFQGRGLTVLAVNVKDSRKDAVEFAETLGLTFPLVSDPKGDVGLLYGAWGLPATYLIGHDGITLARAWGPADWYSPGAKKLIGTLLETKNDGR